MADKIYLLIALVLLFGLLLAGIGIRRLFTRRQLSGGINILFGITLVALAVGMVGVSANLYTYHQLAGEQFVGTLSFERFAPKEFVVTLNTANTEQKVLQYTIFGDECQLDARILKWKYFANLIGFDTAYRLERISGRYREVGDETKQQRSVHSLSENPGIEIWALLNRFNDKLPWVDAHYGNAIYVPMAHGAIYTVTVSNSGLISRPENAIAKQAISGWR